MGLQQFKTEPRTYTPFDRFYVRLLFDLQFASEPYMKNDSEWSTIRFFCFNGAENRAARSLWVGNFPVSTDFSYGHGFPRLAIIGFALD